MYIDSYRFQKDAYVLANKIQKKLLDSGEKQYDGIIIVARGGLHLGYYIADMLGIRCIDIISIESPHSGLHNRHIIHIKPMLEANKNYLFVDDLIDTGETFMLIQDMYKGYNFDFAVLYEKEGHTFKTKRNIYSVGKAEPGKRIDFYYES